MASPKTLEMRAWREKSDRWLKGYYIWEHIPGTTWVPYRRKFGVPKRKRNYGAIIQPDLQQYSWPKM